MSGAVSESKVLQLHVSSREYLGGMSHQIIAVLKGSKDVRIVEVQYDEARQSVQDGKLDGFVAFPPDFTESIFLGTGASLEVVVDAQDTWKKAALEGLARGIAGQVEGFATTTNATVGLTLKESMASGGMVDAQALMGAIMAALQASNAQGTQSGALVVFRTEQVGDIEPFKPSNYTLPGYLTMFVFFSAALSAEAIARERKNRTLERLLSNGTMRESVILGKFLAALYIALLQLAVFWLVGALALHVDLGAAPAVTVIVSVLMALASAAFGVMLASMVRTERSGGSAAVLASLVAAPIGGCWWPLFIMPEGMQMLARITPHAWANSAFNKMMLFGASGGDVVVEMVALLIFALVFVAVALLRFRLSS
jgi:ABC-2 type transport system permease protein